MVGNVWEWTRSLNKSYPYDPADDREDLGKHGIRVLRGGAFYGDAGRVRCAARAPLVADSRRDDVGFRVVVAPGFASDL
jgi:formylglycine-generating enzyme required for sulfatase activity